MEKAKGSRKLQHACVQQSIREHDVVVPAASYQESSQLRTPELSALYTAASAAAAAVVRITAESAVVP